MKTRGYFGIGVEGVSKPMNFGNLARSAYGFGAGFVFTLTPGRRLKLPGSDTPNSQEHMPWYNYASLDEFKLPEGCRLVGVELTDDAVELPSFRHPTRAAYIMGPENGSLSPQVSERCEFIVKIPTAFCLNVATAGAIIMYDRIQSMGRFKDRPVRAGGPPLGIEEEKHVYGKREYSAGRMIKSVKRRSRRTVVGSRYQPSNEGS